MTANVRFAVVGCGNHTRSHIEPGIWAGLELAAVYDFEPAAMQRAVSRAKAAGQKAPVAICESYDDLLNREDVQAVVIITRDEFHAQQLEAAVQAGKHVLVEKPIATDSDGLCTVKNSFAVAKGRGLVVTTCHPRRVSSPYVWAKTNLERFVRQFGALTGIALSFDYPVLGEINKHTSLLIDHFSHEIDWVRFLLGDKPFVVRRMNVRDKLIEYGAHGKMAGVEFSFYGSRKNTDKKRVFAETIRLDFEHGWCSVSTATGEVREHYNRTGRNVRMQIAPVNYDQHFTSLMAGFAASINGQASGYSLTWRDMLVNTESTISLDAHGEYAYTPER